jgi:molecular chaperone GrpE
MKKQADSVNTEKLEKECQEWQSKYLRALADYQNLEKRIAQSRGDEVKHASAHIVSKLLTAVDTLEKADVTLKDQGLTLGIKQLTDALKSEQVDKMAVIGKPFDPVSMECIQVVESDKDGIVVEVLREGYTMHGQVIRVAHVKVGQKVDGNPQKEDQNGEIEKPEPV